MSWQSWIPSHRFFLALLAATSTSSAEPIPPPTHEPFLRIEPGMHTGPIWRISVDRNCNLIATGSIDKTVRLWSLPSEEAAARPREASVPPGAAADIAPVRTFRPPIERGNAGKIYAIALSPDGKFVVAGGWSAESTVAKAERILVFDTKTGSLTQRLEPGDEVIHHLAFSPDGQYLVATLGNGKGVRVWQTQSAEEWPLVLEDPDYSRDSFGAAFDRKNNLYTIADDGYVRRYDSGFTPKTSKPAAKMETTGGKQPYSLSIHPSGDRIAIGFADANAVDVYDVESLERLFAVDVTGIDNREMSVVSWSTDGKRLYATGQSRRPGANPLWVWDDSGRGGRRELRVGPQDVIWQLVPCGSGIAFGAADPAWGVLDETDARRFWKGRPSGSSLSAEGEHISVSRGGQRIAFAVEPVGRSKLLFDLETNQLTDVQSVPNDLFEANVTGLNITDWTYSSGPKLDGNPIELLPNEVSRALAITADNSQFVLGTDYRLRAYKRDGTPAWPRPKTIESPVTDLNITRDGKLFLAAYGDGTIRWHRMDDGKELLALFVHTADRRWIAWTPKGYYAASPGGEDLIGWHVNRGWDEAADFFPATRFRDQFYRPDIVRMVMKTLDEEEALKRAKVWPSGLAAGLAATDLGNLPPLVTIQFPRDGDPVTSTDGEVLVKYSVRSPSGLPITRVFALIDGLPAKDAEAKGFVPVSDKDEGVGELKVRIPRRDVKLSLIAETEHLASEAATIELHWEGPSPVTTGELPVLYALIIGVGEYDKVGKLGDFPARDAVEFAQQLSNQKGLAFRDVRKKILTDKTATKDNIINELQWLMDEVQDDRDIALVFFSGHGKTESGTSYLLPVNFDPKAELKTGLDKFTLRSALRKINGTRLLVLDACYAGKGVFDTNDLGNDFRRDEYGIITLASSLATERSYADHRGSLFTRAIIEELRGLDSESVSSTDRDIMTDELDRWLKKRVPRLVDRIRKPGEELHQTPFLFKPVLLDDVRMAVIKD